jgi:predicted nucleotidyltransferase
MTDQVQAQQTLEQVRSRRAEILMLASRRGATHVRIFGSLARGEQTPMSDVDILVRFAPTYRLLDQVGLKVDLERLLECPVDVANEATLREEYRDAILAEAVPL